MEFVALGEDSFAGLSGAFIEGPRIQFPGRPGGELTNLTFAAKDIFDVAGHRTGCGNPDWLQTHGEAVETAAAIQALVEAGASLIGKTQTDELAYSLNGENAHYGTPNNPNAPGRLPGGSSSGSAVAVASSLVNFAIGTDTAGSIRIPASYCGVYGFRPSHGRVDIAGCMPLAPSFDTVGWFACDPDLLALVGRSLLGSPWKPIDPPSRLLISTEALDLLAPDIRQSIMAAAKNVVAGLGLPLEETSVARGELAEWSELFRRIQGREVWNTHGGWVLANQPHFGPGVRERFELAAELSKDDPGPDAKKRSEVRDHMAGLLAGGTLLIVPSAVGIAPLLNTAAEELNEWRLKTIMLTSIAGLAGLPQVTMPLAELDGLPIGLSLIGAAGSDELVLAAAMSV